jgi:hypothetical protein
MATNRIATVGFDGPPMPTCTPTACLPPQS